MIRWPVMVVAALVAAAAGFLLGRMHGEVPQASTPAAAHREEPRETKEEALSFARDKADLEERLQQVLNEQERLAQENEILRKQQATTRVVGTTRDALPEIPPK